jgi:Ni,Fe-hydrogenase III small subunit/formate hydrogenlyase subunit 6/NADH:ubiquinone oxidoreductase subunit I
LWTSARLVEILKKYMFNLLKVRLNQGFQTIKDIKNARPPEPFRGLPIIQSTSCPQECSACIGVCPTGAITCKPPTIDLKKCIFCPECERACPEGIITFSNNPHIAATNPDSLIITAESPTPCVRSPENIRRIFGNSLNLRFVSAGGCNGCEMELNASSNVHFDMGRFGISFTASPRHSDGVVLTGPLTVNMVYAFNETLAAVPEPKIFVLVGTCALSGGVFSNSPAIDRSVLKEHDITLYVPGCPPHPLTFVNALIALLGQSSFKTST